MTTTLIAPAHMRALADDHRSQLCDWARANGINPDNVSADHPIAIRHPRWRRLPAVIRYRAFVRDRSGAKIINRRGTQVRTRRRSAPLRHPLPTAPAPMTGPR